jgi:hypothetical protein
MQSRAPRAAVGPWRVLRAARGAALAQDGCG